MNNSMGKNNSLDGCDYRKQSSLGKELYYFRSIFWTFISHLVVNIILAASDVLE